MLPVDYLPGARRDFDESFDWYAERSKQAALRFVNAVDAALTVIAANPQRFAEIDNVHRECTVRRFPFRIIYRVVENRIIIVAIAHAKRRPGFWKQR
jgi:plasmid stabilization system protein ParE